MESILSAFPAILKYGPTGLCALLFFFAFLLLRQQNQKEKPNQTTLKTIRTHIYVSFASAMVSLVSTTIDAWVNHRKTAEPTTATSKAQRYRVVGTIIKENGKLANDVNIFCRYPLRYPSPEGQIIGLSVWRDPDGNLPELTFSHSEYIVTPIDLNDKARVLVSGGEVRILSPVFLKEDPKK
jgi:preprotein translocase subunit YajC